MANRERFSVERRKSVCDKKLRVEIIQLHHNVLVVGYGER